MLIKCGRHLEQVRTLRAVADGIKPSSAESVAALHRLGLRTVMLSGDDPACACAIAAQMWS